jgi:uncharacterized protein YkwD
MKGVNMRFLIVLLAAIGLVAITGCPSRNPEPVSTGVLNKDNVLWYINSYRSKPLVRDAQLDEAAQAHADWMAKNNKMSHQQSWFGSKPSDRVSATGYHWRGVAENIAMGQRTEKEVTTAWYNSSGHRRNMQGDYRHIGIGIAYADDGSIYWCTVFANPA